MLTCKTHSTDGSKHPILSKWLRDYRNPIIPPKSLLCNTRSTIVHKAPTPVVGQCQPTRPTQFSPDEAAYMHAFRRAYARKSAAALNGSAGLARLRRLDRLNGGT